MQHVVMYAVILVCNAHGGSIAMPKCRLQLKENIYILYNMLILAVINGDLIFFFA